MRPSILVLLIGAGCSSGLVVDRRTPEVRVAIGIAAVPVPVPPKDASCLPGQIRIERFCIDQYEAYVVELDERGEEHAHSPYDVVNALRVRAKVAANVVPQAYISQIQAGEACAHADVPRLLDRLSLLRERE
jgi:hypothetical protein